MADVPVECKPNGVPRHMCMNCREGMHGGNGGCGFQWVDDQLKAKKGYCIDLAEVHPEGKKEAEAFNNDGVLMCTECAEKLSKQIDKSNNFNLLR